MAENNISKKNKFDLILGAAALTTLVIGAFDFIEGILSADGADIMGLLIYPAIVVISVGIVAYRKTR